MKKFVFFFIMFLLTYGSVNADFWQWGREDNARVSVFFTQSVRNSDEYTDIFTNAMNNWNNISPNVSLRRVNSDRNVGTFVFVAQNNELADVIWLTRLYTRDQNGIAWVYNIDWAKDMTWPRTDVYIFENVMNDVFRMNRMEKISNATHEFWHSLKLDHPTSLWFWQQSVMKSGVQNIWPQDYDQDELRTKWWQ